MELLKNNVFNSNKKKIKIKTFTDIQSLASNSKKFPILTLNTQSFRQNSHSNGKLILIKKENTITERKIYTKEELEKENKELKKKIEILESENKQLRTEIREFYLNFEEEKNLSPHNNQFSFNFRNKFQSFQELSLPLNNNFQPKLYINLRKSANLKDNSLDNKFELYNNIFSKNETSPKKIIIDSLNHFGNKEKSNGSLINNNIDLSSIDENEIKNKMNKIKKRMLTLLNKYTEIINCKL
jgi:hypothetical protein